MYCKQVLLFFKKIILNERNEASLELNDASAIQGLCTNTKHRTQTVIYWSVNQGLLCAHSRVFLEGYMMGATLSSWKRVVPLCKGTRLL